MYKWIVTKFKNQIIRVKEWRDEYLFNKYKKKALFPFDENWFGGKRVAIIGGADSAYKDKLGEYIDDFDVVVRINNGISIIDKYSEYIGKRTDFLFHSFYDKVCDKKNSSPLTMELWKKHNVGKIVCCYHISNAEYRSYIKDFILRTGGKEVFYQLSQELMIINSKVIEGYKPTTGFSAINTVLACQPRSVYITGVTFFKTGHNKDYRDFEDNELSKLEEQGLTNHKVDLEYKYFKDLLLLFPEIIILDKTLKNIIDLDVNE